MARAQAYACPELVADLVQELAESNEACLETPARGYARVGYARIEAPGGNCDYRQGRRESQNRCKAAQGMF